MQATEDYCIKAKMPRISVVRFSKDQFMTLPLAERELLLRIGLAQNDLMVAARIWGAHLYRHPTSATAQEANVIQQMSTLFIFLGKLFEAVRVFETRFSSQPIGCEYRKLFTPGQVAATQCLKAANGSKGLWAGIRNGFAFHYPDADFSHLMNEWDGDRQFSIYFGDPDANSMSMFAMEPFLLSFMKMTGKPDPQAALLYVQAEASTLLQAFRTFVCAVQLVALPKVLGKRPELEDCELDISEFLPQDLVSLPFFMGTNTNYKESDDQMITPTASSPSLAPAA